MWGRIGNEQGDITKKLEEFCNISTKYEGKNYENWQCYYKNKNKNKCKMEPNSKKDKDKPKITKFHNFFEFWVTYLLTDTILWNDKFKTCMNNTNITDCSDGCNKHCVCFDKWVKQKEQEWNKIKELLTKEQNMVQQYYHKINYHFQGYFFHVMDKLNHDEAKWKELTQELKKKIDSSKGNEGTKDSQDAIKVLLDYLKEKSTICKDNNTIEACSSNMNPQKNPCANNSTTTTGGDNKHATVKQIAQYLKRKAYYEANKRSDGLHKLKGKAHEGIYKRGAKKNDFKDNLCRIMIKHSNRDTRRSKQPCAGKDGQRTMFQLLKGWENGRKVTEKHLYDVFLPPRRQHFCTSNLEYLINGVHQKILKIQKGKINHSFLVHVLLAAKMDAQEIITRYKNQNGLSGKRESIEPEHKEAMCRAIRYSFADIGDIIRGRDLWNRDESIKNLEPKLKHIFGKIKDKLPNGIKHNYEDPNYIKLREDWWEANRHQVWESMKCAMKNGITCGSSDHTPLDDYIPQKLRWMTEWAEWYCKVQKKAYKELKDGCQKCMDKDASCWKGESVCEKCTAACDAYKEKIEPWRIQWETVSAIYQILYKDAEIYAGNGGPGYYNTKVQKEDKPVVDFLYELHLQNGGKKGPPAATHPSKSVTTLVKRDTTVDTPSTVYSTAEGYVHQELPNVGCVSQKFFCNTNGNEDKYVFREKPKDHDEACKCENNTKPTAPKRTLPSTQNPCVNGGDSSGAQITSVRDVAEEMQKEVHEGMLKRSGDKSGKGDKSCLEGDINKAQFENGTKGSALKGDICRLEKQHTNAKSSRGYTYKGPCTGKDGDHKMFEVKDGWKSGKEIEIADDVYLPPRREHFCTSNLENLNTDASGLKGDKAMHTLLVYVLLAAKEQADFIKEKYTNKKNPHDFSDDATKCRAMKYSFADIGDIIKGTDLWDQNKGEKDTQRNLEQIFEKIKDELGSKYTGDETKPPYKQLRSDWWEANRDQVWEAMKCHINDLKDLSIDKSKSHCGYSDHTPLDDYIPQRLRWMTEWAEWYCKVQKKAYEELVKGCKECKGGKCMNGDPKCTTCMSACAEYWKKIQPWKQQWEKIKEKYNDLYKRATESGGPIKSNDPKDQEAIEFLSKLQKKFVVGDECMDFT
ncbi:hypothetical protein PFTANZ_06562 [Plasmodium falciparum Tanzania (2000708)]|uniref:Uncharacterized protein n=1 Tax=Plasmodium falciparum Tanzania (2000708) TaxID=1036725 RepID=A0A024VW74_PLAFA|nr:hypothetical protein PFTANZ_06562 [Plasmodium falciparum Tanzania (2000708)]